MHKLQAGLSLLLVSLVALSGCGGPEEDPSDELPVETSLPAQEEAPVPVGEQADPLPVTISTSVSLRSDRRLMVEGETNLPDRAQVQVVVERELSRVRWQSRTVVNDGQFSAGPFGSGSGLPDGGYIVRVQLSEASVQPESVQKRIGNKGEYLAGELISQSRHGLGQVATYSRRFLVGDEPRRTRDQVEVH